MLNYISMSSLPYLFKNTRIDDCLKRADVVFSQSNVDCHIFCLSRNYDEPLTWNEKAEIESRFNMAYPDVRIVFSVASHPGYPYGLDTKSYRKKEEATIDVSDINNYQQCAARTINQKLSDEDKLMHSLIGMSSEVGELHSIFQKRLQGHPIDNEHVIKELGDIMWMIAEFCTVMQIDMSTACTTNINKLQKRYPDGFDPDKSLNREEGDI